MMFASKAPGDLGCTCYVTPESMWFTHYGAVEPGSQMEPNYECFEHFPHVQHNEPNPILLDFRDMHGDAQLWLETIHGPEGDAFLAETPKEFGYIDSDVIDHARRVLTRLARLAEVAS